ncbi:MAG: TMEM165/GDT1 family protein [Candidatus Bipolaricaulota bacterium]|jgi:Ca2+/H+ antiporter, TMEM165/GDT1 family|nr:TMEM165/GDT1 family protein [Candidatus Bipolaricaulota bacterium]
MLKIALSTFALVFLAELGDKTQLAVFTLAAETTSPWGVLIGAGIALLLSTVLAVLLAVALHHLLPDAWTKWIRVGAGTLFILVGVWTIWKA